MCRHAMRLSPGAKSAARASAEGCKRFQPDYHFKS